MGVCLRVTNFTAGVSTASQPVLKNVTLRVLPQEIVGVLGASGSGKSSLLKHSLGIFSRRTVVAGTCHWEDTDTGCPLQPADLRKRVKFVALRDAGVGDITVREAIRFQLRLRACESSPDHVDQALSILGLSQCADNIVGDESYGAISHGQRRRLALGLEIIGSPECLVLDEPTSGMDAKSTADLMQLLRDHIRGESGRCALLSIHQPSAKIFGMLDKVCVLAAGRMIFWGTPNEALAFFTPELAEQALVGSDLASLDVSSLDPLERLFVTSLAYQEGPSNVSADDEPSVPEGLEHRDSVDDGAFDSPAHREEDPDKAPLRDLSVFRPTRDDGVGTQRRNPLSIYWISLQQQTLVRCRERAFVRSTVILFLALSFIISCLYWGVPKRLEKYPMLPHSFQSPPELYNSDAELRRLEAVPTGVAQQTRYYWSALIWGLDGKGAMPWADLINKGVNGDMGEVIPWRLAWELGLLPDFGDCMYDKLKLAETYPSTEKWPDIRDEFPDKSDATIKPYLSLLFKYYQIFDYAIIKKNFTDTAQCFYPDGRSSAQQYLCAVSTQKDLVNDILDCIHFPRLSLFSDVKEVSNFIEKLLPLSSEENQQDPPQISNSYRPALPQVTEAQTKRPSSAMAERRRLGIDRGPTWEDLLLQFPMDFNVSQLAASVLTSSTNRQLAEEGWNRIFAMMGALLDKAKRCDLKMCGVIHSFPSIILGLVTDLVHHVWTGLNVSALLFVLTAVTGCWGFESALSMPQTRPRLNRDVLNGTVTYIPFGLARLTIDVILQSIPIVFLIICVFFSAELGGAFEWMLLILLLLSFSANGLSVLVSVLCQSVTVTLLVSAGILTILLLMSGFVLRAAVSEPWYQVVSSVSPFRFGYIGLMKVYFREDSYFGIFSGWFASEFMGGVRAQDLSYQNCAWVLFLQGFIFRAAALAALPFCHTKAGLRNA